MKYLRTILLALALLVSPGAAHALGLEVAVGGWWQDPSGYISYEAVGVGDRLDLERDAGYGKEFRPTGRVKIDMPLIIPNIYLMATPMEFSGTGSKATTFTFGDRTFAADIPFTSESKLDHYDVALYYGVPVLGLATLGTVNVDLGINVRFLEVDAVVRQGNDSYAYSTSLAVPMVYVGVQITPGKRFALELEGRAISYSSNRYVDLLARLKVQAYGPLYMAGGWRQQDIKIDASGVEADFKVGGPFLETGFAF
ncbi:TIGR04219 family outer membrane beta-barrel protein [Desulfurivibrio sp. D14AmB]|uniref:TIGR04219 family outer membrane beta-barrel protein n=1 Tax=Desulfurivibrio sp. D14AmB TaxID=3374370 RepID=UPI00376EF8D4